MWNLWICDSSSRLEKVVEVKTKVKVKVPVVKVPVVKVPVPVVKVPIVEEGRVQI